MPLTSTLGNSIFYDGSWYCECGEEARWYTSQQEASKGERFGRCPGPREQQCRFFLAEADDIRSRLVKSSDVAPAPRTPTGTRGADAAAVSLLTPETGTNVRRRLFANGSSRKRPAPDHGHHNQDTPAPRRLRLASSLGGDEDGDDLPTVVFGLLEKDGIVLKTSTKAAIRHAIGEYVAPLKAKWQNSKDSLDEAFEKIDELETRDDCCEPSGP
ncbi:ZIP family zinc transporter [Purpureocillium lavendulum]|uniref:ZIP family zinc transporter n=1 Tax=Purpureocillium lavendulum TaxID=1247861 RepID=A0AB34FUV2_9HYPO|nr:ZIP family zinc transporter [Purpureocillium lavendulum]